MLDLLQDNYTRFLSPSEYMEYQVDTLEKEFAGVGVRMQNVRHMQNVQIKHIILPLLGLSTIS